MEIRKIFVASSINTFEKERKCLGSFFSRLNNQSKSENIFYDVKFCEELDNAVPEVRKQNEYNQFIMESNLVIFLLSESCGNYTFEEFQKALQGRKDAAILVFHQKDSSLDEKTEWIRQQAEIHQKISYVDYTGYQDVEQQLYEHINSKIKWPEVSDAAEIHKEIKIFLGTSDFEYEEEHNAILRFILNLNEKLLKKHVYVEVEPCDPKNMPWNDKEYKTYIEQADAVFFLFFLSANERLKKELSESLDSFYRCGKPKIYTYFYNHTGIEDTSILELKHRIGEELNHYYSLFTNVDSIKLSILIQISDIMQDACVISLENDCIMMQDEVVLDLNQIPIVSRNRVLNELKQHISEVEQEYEKTALQFSADTTKRELLNKLSQLDDERTQLQEKRKLQEKEILSMLYEMHRTIAKGKIDDLLREAYKCLENGEAEKAAKILNKPKVDEIFKLDMHAKMESIQDDASAAVEMYVQTIKIQKLLGESPETVQMIMECYEEIMTYVTMIPFLNSSVIAEYAEYLDLQNDPKAEQVWKQAEYLYSNPVRHMSKASFADLYINMGKYFFKQQEVVEAEECFQKAYDLKKELYGQNPGIYAESFADACLLLENVSFFCKAELLEEGMDAIWKCCQENLDEKHILQLADYYLKSGFRYGVLKGLKQEEEVYRKGIELLETHQIQDTVLVNLYNNLAQVLEIIGQKEECETFYKKAIAIQEALYVENQETHTELLGSIYNNICAYYRTENKYDEALQCLEKCKKVCTARYEKNPVRGGRGLAECYIHMAIVYDAMENKKEVIPTAEKGVAIYEYLYAINPNRFAIELSWAYRETGSWYILAGDIVSGIDKMEKSMSVLVCTENVYIKQHIREAMLTVFDSLALIFRLLNESKEERKVCMPLLHKIFKYGYEHLKELGCANRKAYGEKAHFAFIEVLYKIGVELLDYYEKKDPDLAKTYYYQTLYTLGEDRLKDPDLSPEDKYAVEQRMSVLETLIGDIENGADC